MKRVQGTCEEVVPSPDRAILSRGREEVSDGSTRKLWIERLTTQAPLFQTIGNPSREIELRPDLREADATSNFSKDVCDFGASSRRDFGEDEIEDCEGTDVELPLVSFVKSGEGVEDLVEDTDDLCFRGHRTNRTEDIVGDLRRNKIEVSSVSSSSVHDEHRRKERRNVLLRKTEVDLP